MKSGLSGAELAERWEASLVYGERSGRDQTFYLDEGRSHSQIAKIVGRGSETSVRHALAKARESSRW